MPQDPFRVATLHLVYSFECNLHCAHCLYRCGPGQRETLGLNLAFSALEQAARAGIRRVVFNGGEPTLRYQELLALLRGARSLGLSPALITNAYWAISGSRARAALSGMRTAGLQAITVSTDRFHLLHVPARHVFYAVEAAREAGVRAGVKIARLESDPIAEGLRRDLQPVADAIVLQPVSPLGRASSLRGGLALKAVRDLGRPGCRTPPVLLPDGRLLTCCNLPAQDLTPPGYPFVLGSLKRASLQSLLSRRARNPLLEFLRRRGPGPLFTFLAKTSHCVQAASQSVYRDGCELCFHLSRRLLTRGWKEQDDFQPQQFTHTGRG